MNLLFTLNEGYLPPLYTLLRSIFKSNNEETLSIYLMHQSISPESMLELTAFIEENGHHIYPIACQGLFEEEQIIVNRYYSIEMYYRLFAPFVLPAELDRILYLDPDIVNINPFSDFYRMEFREHLFVATTHDYATKWIQPINNIRIGTLKAEDYFNTGVLLMNLPKIRREKTLADITKAIKEYKNRLVLPDQDIFNHLYWNRILEADWRIYNLDPRFYSKLCLIFPKEYNLEWVEANVVFVHYCGKHKPWLQREDYRYELGSFYEAFEEGNVSANVFDPILEDETR